MSNLSLVNNNPASTLGNPYMLLCLFRDLQYVGALIFLNITVKSNPLGIRIYSALTKFKRLKINLSLFNLARVEGFDLAHKRKLLLRMQPLSRLKGGQLPQAVVVLIAAYDNKDKAPKPFRAQCFILARVEGFEPPNARTKTWCLTTWPHPNKQLQNYIVYL